MESVSGQFEIKFTNMFYIMIYAMRLNKSHPDIPRNIKWILQFSFFHGCFFCIFGLLMYSTFFHDIKRNDFTQACANGILGVIFGVVTYQYCIMLWFQTLFKNMIEKMDTDYELAKSFPIHEQNVILEFAKKGVNIVKIWVMIACCSGGVFPLKSVILMTYYYIFGEFKFVPLYDLTYPSPVEEAKNELNVFIMLYIVFAFYDIYATIMYIAFAPLGPIFMLHACGQLEIARTRMLAIFKNNDDPHTIQVKLKNIIIHLQDIYYFVDDIKDSMKVLYELTLKATVMILPICMYQIIESFHVGEIKVEFITILFGGVFISGIPCYYSDVLMEAGEKMRLAVYMCGWETHWDPKIRTLVKLLLLRASRPVAVRTMFRLVCLDALTDVYHQAYAIFNLLNAAWE